MSTSPRQHLRRYLARAGFGSWAAVSRGHPEIAQGSIFRALAGVPVRSSFVDRLALALGVRRHVLARFVTVAERRPQIRLARRHNDEVSTLLDDLLGGRSDVAVQHACGVSANTLRAWRSGAIEPREDAIRKLATLIGKPPGYVAKIARATVVAAREARR